MAVREIMSCDVVTVPERVGRLLARAYGDDTRAEALTVADALPVIEGGRLVGIVSRTDLVRAFAGQPDARVHPTA